MNLSVIQFETLFNNKVYNSKKIISYINDINSDILVFPELATSGYYFTDKNMLSKIAEEFDGNTIKKAQKLSTDLDKIIILGFPELFKDKIYNSAAIIFPNQNLSSVYRKTHLFYKERFVFEEGNTGFPVIEYNGLKLGTMICYDWRFPEAARTLALKGADLIVCPSNLVTGVWQNVMSARALENKVYIAVSNKIGIESSGNDKLTFNGESAIYSYDGSYLAKASKDKEEVIKAEIYPEETREKSFNDVNDIFKDRRPQYYK
ncbi:MAG: nitrilase-related carbon-nitrogen hydrolase [Candidatus Kapaibacterium sp.]